MIGYRWFVDKKETSFESFLDIVATIGLILIALVSIKIQLLRIFPVQSNGVVVVPDPLRFNSLNYLTEKVNEMSNFFS